MPAASRRSCVPVGQPRARQEHGQPSGAALLASRKAILKTCLDLESELRALLPVFGTCLAPRVGHGSLGADVRRPVREADPVAGRIRAADVSRRTARPANTSVQTLFRIVWIRAERRSHFPMVPASKAIVPNRSGAGAGLLNFWFLGRVLDQGAAMIEVPQAPIELAKRFKGFHRMPKMACPRPPYFYPRAIGPWGTVDFVTRRIPRCRKGKDSP